MSWTHAGAALVHMFRGDWEAAYDETDAAIAVGRERSDATIVSFNLFVRSFAQLEQRDFSGGIKSAEASLETAPTIYFRSFPQLLLARATFHRGEPRRAIQIQSAVLDFLESSRHILGWLLFSPGLIEQQIASGALDDARARLERLEEAATRGRALWVLGVFRRLRAELGDLSRFDLRRGLAELRAIGAQNELALSLKTLAELEDQAGDVAAAAAARLEATAIFDRLGTLVEVPGLALPGSPIA
jgi:hypothetical protein